MNLLVTGGCGFIGSNLVRYLRQVRPDWKIVNLDKLTYAGNLENLKELEGDPKHVFIRGDINDKKLLAELFATHGIEAVMHLAAESHVDRSILGPEAFTVTNVLGTQVLLGIGAFLNKLGTPVFDLPPKFFSTAHIVTGSLAMATTVILAMNIHRVHS